jgi:hypothetical protein
MPQLVKLQAELKDTGFTIIAPHAQSGTQEEVAMVARQLKMMNIIVPASGDVPGEKVEGIPMQFLFDASGKLVEKGHHIPPAKVQALVASEPHFLAAGRAYKKHKAEADALKKSKTYGSILKKLDKSLSGKDDAAEEAKYLAERIRAHGQRKLDEAKESEGSNAFAAQQAYTDIAAVWKGDAVGEKASARLKELKTDKAFQSELKASTLLHQILSECDKLVAQGGKINHGYGPNQKIVASVRASAAALKKKYPDSKTATNLPELLKDFGFTDI